MPHRDAKPLVWECCTQLLEKYVRSSFDQGFLPNPPLESPDFPAQHPTSKDILLTQTLGLFSIDKAGFNAKLSEILELLEPDYVKRHIDPDTEREKWAIKNVKTISKRILILQIRDWLAVALDESAPDTDRWYFAISTLIGMCFEASDICRDYCFNFLVSISMAKSPFYKPSNGPSGPHHIAWNPEAEVSLDEDIPHPSGILATNIIFDYLSVSPMSSTQILPNWIENFTSYPLMAQHLNLFSRIKLALDTCTGEQAEPLIRATVQLMPDNLSQSKEILIFINSHSDVTFRRNLAASLSKIYNYDNEFTLFLLDNLLLDTDDDTCVLATRSLGFLARMDMPAFLQRAPMVVKHGNQRAMQILVHSGILQYLNYDITDKIELLPNLWVACNETARSKLVSFILDQARLDKLAFLKTAQKIFEADQEAFLEFHRWIGMRDESLQEILNYIQIDNNIITDIEKIRYNLRLSAEEAHKKGNSLLWFEQLYSEAKRNPENIPWASLRPNEHLISWIKQFSTNVNSFTGKRALIVGCGLGDDAIALSEIGMEVYAFDIAKSSIEWCKERFPKSKVHWSVNDLKHLPSEWCGTFDLVVEIHILQAVHPDVRDELAAALIPLLGENGQLLCIGRKKEEDNRDLIDNIGPPWPLKKSWFELWFSELELIDYTDISESIKNPLGNVIEIKRYRANFQRQF